MKPADLGRLDIEDSAKLIRTVALALWTKHMLVKWDHPCKHHQKHIAAKIVILKHCHVSGMDMMAAIGMMVGGAIVNALAFTGGSYLFSLLGDKSAKAEKERKRHDLAVEEL